MTRVSARRTSSSAAPDRSAGGGFEGGAGAGPAGGVGCCEESLDGGAPDGGCATRGGGAICEGRFEVVTA